MILDGMDWGYIVGLEIMIKEKKNKIKCFKLRENVQDLNISEAHSVFDTGYIDWYFQSV